MHTLALSGGGFVNDQPLGLSKRNLPLNPQPSTHPAQQLPISKYTVVKHALEVQMRSIDPNKVWQQRHLRSLRRGNPAGLDGRTS